MLVLVGQQRLASGMMPTAGGDAGVEDPTPLPVGRCTG